MKLYIYIYIHTYIHTYNCSCKQCYVNHIYAIILIQSLKTGELYTASGCVPSLTEKFCGVLHNLHCTGKDIKCLGEKGERKQDKREADRISNGAVFITYCSRSTSHCGITNCK